MTRLAIAAALAIAAPQVFAQDIVAVDVDRYTVDADWAELIRTRDITGSPIYTVDEAYDEGSWGGGLTDDDYAWGWSDYDAIGADWNRIGEIEDVVLDNSGGFRGVVAEVGGFLDIGDKHVLLRMEDVDLAPSDDGYMMITRLSEEELEALPGVDEGWWE